MLFSTLIFILSIAQAGEAPQDQSPARESLVMMAHWDCATWAGMANDTEGRAEHHFLRGLESGRRFVEAARSGAISEDDWDSTVPVYVALSMQGPTSEFVLGRLFEVISGNAFDEVTKRDAYGRPLPPEDYINDRAVQAVVASRLMRQANCSVL